MVSGSGSRMPPSPNRLFFLITLVVLGFIFYFLQRLTKENSTVYGRSKILPNYERTFSVFNHKRTSTEQKASKFVTQTNADYKETNERYLKEKYQPTTQNIADDSAIFYIDPPDHPIPAPKTRPPLVNKFLQNGGKQFPGDEGSEESVTSNLEQQEKNEEFIHEGNLPTKKEKYQNSSTPRLFHGPQRASQIHNMSVWLPKIAQTPSDDNNSAALSGAWQKLREEQHRLIEEKIRWYKEKGHLVTPSPQELLHRRRLPLTDPKHWLGLESTTVEERYPGILFSREYRLRPFIDLDDPLAVGMDRKPQSVENMTDGHAEDRFYQLLTMTHIDCADIRRLGNTDDGGWDVCLSEPYNFQTKCLVYSFGINFDFSFDDAIAEMYGCQVRTFDPSMQVGDHMHQSNIFFYQLGLGTSVTVNSKGWRMETMARILHKLGHHNKTIDLLKLDIEFDEWSCLRAMLQDGSLRNVKQISMEIHTPEVFTVARPSTKRDFYRMYGVLYGLEQAGFRKYHFTYNPLGQYTSVRTGKKRSCCYELYFVNIHYLKT